MGQKSFLPNQRGKNPADQRHPMLPAGSLQYRQVVFFRFRQQGDNPRPGLPRRPFVQRLLDGFAIQFNVAH